MSYEYDHLDPASLEPFEETPQEKIPSKFKADVEFILSSDVDAILGEEKSNLVNLLSADVDDLLVMQALKKPPVSNGNSRSRGGQSQSKSQSSDILVDCAGSVDSTL
jgi:hypothetical protein